MLCKKSIIYLYEKGISMSDYSSVSAVAEVQFSKKKREMEAKGILLSEKEEAALYTQLVETQLLTAPASAIFPPLDEMAVQKYDDGTYQVSGFVDSQNSYGAMLRTQFSYRVEKKNGKWNCLETFVDRAEQERQKLREESNKDATSHAVLWWVLGIIGSIVSALVLFFLYGDFF